MILVFGEALVDVIEREGRVPVEVVGGGPLNTAVAAARSGAEVALMCPLSEDERGARISQLLAAEGSVSLGSSAMAFPTALAHASIDQQGHASYSFGLAGSVLEAISESDARAALELSPVAVHLGTLALAIPQMAQVSAFLAARLAEDSLLMVDPNCRPAFLDGNSEFQRAWAAVLPRADVVKVSDQDLAYLYGDDADVALATLRKSTAAVILLTRGAAGVDVLIGDERLNVPAYSVAVVDTVGAGDTFSGAFLARFIGAGRDLGDLGDLRAVTDAVRYACAAAALACTQTGAVPPRAREVVALMQSSEQ